MLLRSVCVRAYLAGRVRAELLRTRIQLNEIWSAQTAHTRLSAQGQPADVVAAGRRRRPRSPAHARGRPSQTAIRSRINIAVPCKHGGRPRMVPAPGGTTTALCLRGGVPRLCMRPRCPGRWLGARAQAPFAVAATRARVNGVDGATPVNRKRCPASVGRRTCPGPPAPAPRLQAARCERQLLAGWQPAFQCVKANLHQTLLQAQTLLGSEGVRARFPV
jgi:hypothetical protein